MIFHLQFICDNPNLSAAKKYLLNVNNIKEGRKKGKGKGMKYVQS